ncbi:hypothetical protein CEE45_04820 [Candidatus Heimdallarchaeota archaeon B3_Heim]|nr:MAG: hypothetical protein CEE45_04820 [Candidatus Heimdallarchaeota archaeon B3_Heim]
MTGRNYILDECLLRHASNLVDHQNQDSTIALKIFIDIGYQCDSILVSNELLKHYYKHISILKERNKSNASILTGLLFRLFPNKA